MSTAPADLTAADLAAAHDAAKAILDTAMAKRSRLQNKINIAAEALSEAQRARQILADEIDAGGQPSRAAQKSSHAALAEAKAELELFVGRMPACDAVVAEASKAVATITARIEYEVFKGFIKQRIEVAAGLDKAAQAFGAAFDSYMASGEALMGAWPSGERLQPHELEALRDRRAAAYILPKALQMLVLQIGGVCTVASLEARERSAWGGRFGV